MGDSAGTTPPGTSSEQQASRWVREMFAGIAPRYDFLNHLLSFNIDRGWRKALQLQLEPTLQQEDAKVLDLCCGTGDVLMDLQSVAKCRVIGADFCHPMLVAARDKAVHKKLAALLVEADGLQLPFSDNALDAISVAFGFRNFANYGAGLSELQRVLKPGGVLAILEFSHPPGLAMKLAYGFYSRLLLPAIGTLVSRSSQAYTYLPESIRKFPSADRLREMMSGAGFGNATYHLLTGGIAALHLGYKLPASTGSQACSSTLDFLPQPKIANQAQQVIGMKT